jgi:RoxA-like, cytochrome c-like
MISYGPTRVPDVSGMSFDSMSRGQRTGRAPALEGARTPAPQRGDYKFTATLSGVIKKRDTMRWMGRGLIVLLMLAVIGVIAFRISAARAPTPIDAPPLPAPLVGEGTNGLDASERGLFYRLSEGGEIFPLDWALALETETGTSDGRPVVRPFLDNIERYGFLSDPKGPANPYGLPVGLSVAPSRISGIQMIGLNCSACHVGQITYRGRALRIDGAPNMVLINAFLRDLVLETNNTMTSPARLTRFWKRAKEIRQARKASDPEAAADESLWAKFWGMFLQNRHLLQARVDAMRTIPTLNNSIRISTKEGYGRLDAFGIGRDELFGGIGANSLPADAPVSFPHLWGMQFTGWLQWSANTNSVMERNIGQALGVGAVFDPKTFSSTVRIDNLHQLENLAYKLQPPAWPEFFPPIDAARAARGRTAFAKYCAACHETWKSDGKMRVYQLFSLSEVGTDPMAALNFERLVQQADGSVTPFPYAAVSLIKRVKNAAYEERKLDKDTIAQWEHRYLRRGPQWEPTFRAPLLDSEKWEDTRGRKVYRSKTLVGIWATAPFLHNGSVPTVYDLLLPVAQRPAKFVLGSREYDPVKLGYRSDQPTLPGGATPFEYDTRLIGNWNTGHEWHFYPELTDDIRYDLIEFLKTFTRS